MENLQTLILNYYHGLAGYPTFFDQFDFPNLANLRIEAEESDLSAGYWNPQAVRCFLEKLSTFRRLEQLAIRSEMGITLSSFIRLFKAVPNITTLELLVPMDYEGYEEVFGELNVLYPKYRANRLKKVVLVANQEIMDELDVLVCAGEYYASPESGFSVQKIIIGDEGEEDEEEEDSYSEKECSNLWVGREPSLKDWMELAAVL
ncbi:hypothetical protein H1R20_g6740, partial [Candolleomyces eurysporus]